MAKRQSRRSSNDRKGKMVYTLFVEGETEQRYFEHIQRLINEHPESKKRVEFIIRTGLNFLKHAKRETANEIYLVFDIEGGSGEEAMDCGLMR